MAATRKFIHVLSLVLLIFLVTKIIDGKLSIFTHLKFHSSFSLLKKQKLVREI